MDTLLACLCIGVAALAAAAPAPAESDLRFSGRISRKVLDNYLSRAVTMMDLCTGKGSPDDNIRMLRSIGARFAGRTVYLWGSEHDLAPRLVAARAIAEKAHREMPHLILQAGVFEIVTTRVADVRVPERVFREFGLPPEDRAFRYEAMLFPDGKFVDHWGKGASVPDMTRLETRMWFWHLATSYIDAGIEAIHFGQIALIGATDRDWVHWRELLGRVRAYARKHARRKLVLCDAHVPDGGPGYQGRLLFDFHSFPMRIKEVAGKPQQGCLEVGYLDSLFRRSKGGITPNGWKCDSLPYIVEFDNWGSSGKAGQGGMPYWTWGYDEICWFAHQPEAYRNEWLRYAWKWVRDADPNGWLQMPGSRCLADPVGDEWWYYANTRSAASPAGYGQEETIKAIWAADGASHRRAR